MSFNAFVLWPGAPLTERLVRRALDGQDVKDILSAPSVGENDAKLLQWATYDAIDHDLTLQLPAHVLASSYIIRKALIRKHFLHRSIQSYVTKYPTSILKDHVPRTWDLEISFSDELDEMWSLELYDLGQELENEEKWFMLKPGMADRGNGIRLFNNKDALQEIFESFEAEDEDEEEDDSTAVVMSQLRNFVIQEYIANPLLLDPSEISLNNADPKPSLEALQGHKFHLRCYCVASGALTLYMYPNILALFSAEPYDSPSEDSATVNENLAPHLTNTSLQRERGEEGVRLFEELVGCHIMSSGKATSNLFTKDHMSVILDQMAEVLADTFRAAIQSPVNFLPLRNAFELYGVDFLVTDTGPTSGSSQFQVQLLEINAEPAIELTGPRLTWILEELFVGIGKVCVEPFFSVENNKEEDWQVGDTKHGLRKCLDQRVRSAEL